MKIFFENNRALVAKKKGIVYGLWVMGVLLLSTPVTAQNFGAQQPNTVFQSTSTMTPTGSQYSANPMINEDGSAYNPSAQAPSGPRKAKMDGMPDMPDNTKTQDNTPIGDALIPLMLCACAYLIIRARKRANKGERANS